MAGITCSTSPLPATNPGAGPGTLAVPYHGATTPLPVSSAPYGTSVVPIGFVPPLPPTPPPPLPAAPLPSRPTRPMLRCPGASSQVGSLLPSNIEAELSPRRMFQTPSGQRVELMEGVINVSHECMELHAY